MDGQSIANQSAFRTPKHAICNGLKPHLKRYRIWFCLGSYYIKISPFSDFSHNKICAWLVRLVLFKRIQRQRQSTCCGLEVVVVICRPPRFVLLHVLYLEVQLWNFHVWDYAIPTKVIFSYLFLAVVHFGHLCCRGRVLGLFVVADADEAREPLKR